MEDTGAALMRFSGLVEDSPTEDGITHSCRSESLDDFPDLVELDMDILEWE